MTDTISGPQPEPTSNGRSPQSSTSGSTLIKPLSEYKELISIIVFFLGGVSFAFAYFATKDQLKQMRCLLNANVDLIQSKMDSASLSQLMVQNIQDSVEFENKSPLLPADIVKKNK